uniref:Pentacotripeptide-repeat region of PRORP domain-containing protein n=2 Tax=Leersia perrieri TaxID=77586 RepID=A0A0D9V5U6_9ORYZ
MSTWAITRGSCGSGLATGIAAPSPPPAKRGTSLGPTLFVLKLSCQRLWRLPDSSPRGEEAASHAVPTGSTEDGGDGNFSSPLARLQDVCCEVRAACICLWIGKDCNYTSSKVCGARGPRPRYPRVWKTRKRIGTISKSKKLVECVKDLSNVKEEVYGALDSFVAWELEFPLIAVKKALKLLEDEKEWKRIIQVIKWMFNKGQGKTIGSHYTLLNALIEDGRVEEAEELYEKIFSRYLEGLPRTFFMRMISLYYRLEAYQKMFEIFADMEELGVKPDGSIIRMLGEVFHKLGMFDKYVQLKRKYPPPKWEYRYIKGKRIRIKVYPENKTHGPIRRNPGTDEVEEEEESMNLDSELEEEASAGLDRNVLDEAACGDLEFRQSGY